MSDPRLSSRRLSTLRRHVVAAPSSLQSVPTAAKASPFKRLLIANRGEIVCRIHRAAKALGIETVGVYTHEDAEGLHPRVVDRAVKLPAGSTPVAPYIDAVAMAELAVREHCDAVHPGYGFLSENELFAASCEKRGVVFVGPTPEMIDIFGDKTKAKKVAANAGVPILESSPGLTSAHDAAAFLKANPMDLPLLLKAAYGGGGRGQAVVSKQADFMDAFSKCSKEAEMSFGRAEVFIERFLPKARHIEVQILGDGKHCVHLFERDCSVQVRKQKVVEIAPSRFMNPALRERICGSAVRLCESIGYRNAGTVEFLVEGDLQDANARFYFLELNPRIQVEHTITEEITGKDLVQTQILLAGGETLESLGITQASLKFKGAAIQVRVGLMPGGGGKVTDYHEPAGVRVDSAVALGTVAVTDYDPMICKLIVKGSNFEEALEEARRAVAQYVVSGLTINKDFLERILNHEEFIANGVHTTWVEDRKLHMVPRKAAKDKGSAAGSTIEIVAPFPGQIAEIKVKPGDSIEGGSVVIVISAMKMLTDVICEYPGSVLDITAEFGAQVNEGQVLARVKATGDAIDAQDDSPLPQASVRRARTDSGGGGGGSRMAGSWYNEIKEGVYATPVLRSSVKRDSADYKKRFAHNKALCDELARRLSVVKQGGGGKSETLHRSRGKNLARERVERIIDEGTSFLELSPLAGWEMYGGGVHSAGRVTGIGVVAGRECMFLGTDATIKGGVIFPMGLKKWERAQHIAETNHLPCIYLIDGGGAKLDSAGGQGRQKSGDTRTPEQRSYDVPGVAAALGEGGAEFYNQARMSGMGIPQIAVVCGMCTAGGAYTPAMCDENIIVQTNGTVYLGGPPLVKAATGEDAEEQSLGGAVMHTSISGTCDHFAKDENTGLAMCREVVENLSRRRARAELHNCQESEPPLYDPEELLGIIPEKTNIPFDIREVIARIVDGSRFHEFKAKYGPTMVCGWAHLDGYPVGILGNNGMIFSEAALKATHFIVACGQRGTPLIFLHNITGFIIGTKFEQGGITKDGAKMIQAVSNVPVPKFTVVCGASNGAGNFAMCGKAFGPRFVFLWPNARISVMGGEQAAGVVAIVKNNQLKREGKPPLSAEAEQKLKAPIIRGMEATDSAFHSSAHMHDDGVIDPRDTRQVLAQVISSSLNAPMPNTSYGVFRM